MINLIAGDTRRIRCITTAVVALVAAVLMPQHAHGQAKACARTATGTWTVNGIVASGVSLGMCSPNTAWSRVVPLKLTPATTPTGNVTATGAISFTRFSDHLFIGITVNNDE